MIQVLDTSNGEIKHTTCSKLLTYGGKCNFESPDKTMDKKNMALTIASCS